MTQGSLSHGGADALHLDDGAGVGGEGASHGAPIAEPRVRGGVEPFAISAASAARHLAAQKKASVEDRAGAPLQVGPRLAGAVAEGSLCAEVLKLDDEAGVSGEGASHGAAMLEPSERFGAEPSACSAGSPARRRIGKKRANSDEVAAALLLEGRRPAGAVAEGLLSPGEAESPMRQRRTRRKTNVAVDDAVGSSLDVARGAAASPGQSAVMAEGVAVSPQQELARKKRLVDQPELSVGVLGGDAALRCVMPEWKSYTPSTVTARCCMARVWKQGQGGQCSKPQVTGRFCAMHSGKEGSNNWLGAVDGPIPDSKLQEFRSRSRLRCAAAGGARQTDQEPTSSAAATRA